jgi:hypothetical protein
VTQTSIRLSASLAREAEVLTVSAALVDFSELALARSQRTGNRTAA